MKLSLAYSACSHEILQNPETPKRLALLKSAGVETLWLHGYFYGEYKASPTEMAKARDTLQNEGFDVGVINVPLGHGGNALDPRDSSIRLDVGEGWRNSVGRNGEALPNTTCIDERVIADTREAAEIFRELGIEKIFYDDDLRLGSWGSVQTACFCPYCVERFNESFGSKLTRDEIVNTADAGVAAAWRDFSCGKILDFLRGVTPPGIRTGIMVMHNGDARHGIDIPAIRREMSDVFFRVGEGHFSDAAFTHPNGERSLLTSIHNHMRLVGDRRLCWSESTVFPYNALSPENLVKKIMLEIRAGLRNIYVMNGTFFLGDEYWQAIAAALPALRELAEALPEPEHPEAKPVWQI